MKNLLITGGAGFIGSHCIEYFLARYPNYTIINLDKLSYAASKKNMAHFLSDPRHIFIHGNITDAKLVDSIFAKYEIEGVIHFAAESHVDNSILDPHSFIKSNIVGTFTLLEIAKKYWKGDKKDNRFHHISTDEVYGSLRDSGIFTENSSYAPNSPYSASKASSDHLVRSYFKTYDLNVVITNCSNNYGPRQHTEKLIPLIIQKALKGEKIPIYGDGRNVRDWIFVKDHCEAIDLVYHQGKPGDQMNVGGCNEIMNIDLARLVCEKLNALYPHNEGIPYGSFIQHVKDRPGHDFRYALSIEKINRELGWVPRTSFEEGLLKTIEYYLEVESVNP